MVAFVFILFGICSGSGILWHIVWHVFGILSEICSDIHSIILTFYRAFYYSTYVLTYILMFYWAFYLVFLHSYCSVQIWSRVWFRVNFGLVFGVVHTAIWNLRCVCVCHALYLEFWDCRGGRAQWRLKLTKLSPGLEADQLCVPASRKTSPMLHQRFRLL